MAGNVTDSSLNDPIDIWTSRGERLYDFSELEKRACVPDIIHFINDVSPQTLLDKRLSNKAELQRLATKLKDFVSTQDELDVSGDILDLLYSHHLSYRSDVITPKVGIPLPREKTVINESTPPLGCCAYVRKQLLTPDKTLLSEFKNEQVWLGANLMFLAENARVHNLSELISLVTTFAIDRTGSTILNDGIQSQCMLTIYSQEISRRWFLRKEAVLAAREVYKLLNTDSYLRSPLLELNMHIEDAVQAWFTHATHRAPRKLKNELANLSCSQVVSSVSFIQRSSSLDSLWVNNTALADNEFLLAATGKKSLNKFVAEKQNATSSTLAPIEWRIADQGGDDRVHRKLRLILRKFGSDSLKENRNTTEYKLATKQLVELSQYSMGWPCALVLRWITKLFKFGSPWKGKLASNTLLNYHSTMALLTKSIEPFRSPAI